MATTQNFDNHARYVPAYHFILFAILLANLVGGIKAVVKYPGLDSTMTLLLAIGLILIAWYARAFAVAVQNRVIRLEETLRMERLLPPDLKARVGELSVSQIVGLRFASDAELPALVRRTLDEKLPQKAIKQAVQQWRPDYMRA